MMLPDGYINVTDTELGERVAAAKERLGKDVCVLGHYYQRAEVVQFADFEGDSFQLAKAGSETNAKYIVFCGVHFMAEASVILAREGQRVFLPNMDAGCPLADFASIEDVERAWGELESCGIAKDFVPIVYMNSSAAVKAFCGARSGTVATSSSIPRAFKWAFENGKKVFFLPDENLGKNSAYAFGIDKNDVAVWDPFKVGGGLEQKMLARARVIVWKGHCHVHTFFTAQHVKAAREKFPGCKIVVHPECSPDVVSMCDASGSTFFLKEYAEKAPPGSTVVIGTEINLVSRLATKIKDKKIIPLARSLCPNMFKTSLAHLCFTLERIGDVNEVYVDNKIASDARLALKRMLELR